MEGLARESGLRPLGHEGVSLQISWSRAYTPSVKKCSIRGCSKPSRQRGWCYMHYYRWRRHGDPQRTLRPYRGPTECSVDRCQRKPMAQGLCSPHYQRLRHHGDVDADRPIRERLGRYVHNGYMLVFVPKDTPGRGKNGYMLEHRYVMQEYLGRPLRSGEEIHHRSGNRLDNRIENLELRIRAHGSGATAPHCATCTCWPSP
jgi:HNH endonuclease